MSSSLKLQPLNSKNRPGAGQLLFDTHMRSVPATFNLLKLRPVALILWTAISTAILKFRGTFHQNYHEVITILAGSVILAHGALFLSLLYEASTQAPGPDIAGKLEVFVDQDQGQNGSTQSSSGSTSSDANAKGAKKRTTESSSSSVVVSSTATPATSIKANKDNKFLVLEKSGEPIGCIGAEVNKARGEAQLVTWAVRDTHQRNGGGTLLLKAMMDQLSESNKKDSGSKIQTVKVVMQGSQVPALRLFHKFGFKQIDRTPEWLGERVVLEITTKEWIKDQTK
ncbi:hypothetical protein BGX27_004628 [Mortierella sp. AM989]|nr:hypothetical protein BGX27_004628 [Mortierella sp. AM989]